MKKQLLKYLLVGACITGLLAGCGQTTTQTGVADTQESTATEETTESTAESTAEESGDATETAEPAENITLKFSHYGSEADQKVYAERLALYEETHPGVTVEQIYITDYPTQLKTMIAGGTAPDVMQIEENIISFAEQGALLPLNDYIDKAGLDLEGTWKYVLLCSVLCIVEYDHLHCHCCTSEYEYEGTKGFPDHLLYSYAGTCCCFLVTVFQSLGTRGTIE